MLLEKWHGEKKSMSNQYNARHFTSATEVQLNSRDHIRNLAKSNLAFEDEFFRGLPLYMHSGILARSLAIQELYLEVRNIPGYFLDFGTWQGSNLILLENFRAIYDSFDHQRQIVGFDTFSGYEGFGANESADPTIQNSTYSLKTHYEEYLRDILGNHELANGKVRSLHQVIKGDASLKFPEFLDANPGAPIALAIFDMNAFQPTLDCLQVMSSKILSGSVIAFWQFARPEITGERKAFEELKKSFPAFRLHKAKTYPSLIYMKFD